MAEGLQEAKVQSQQEVQEGWTEVAQKRRGNKAKANTQATTVTKGGSTSGGGGDRERGGRKQQGTKEASQKNTQRGESTNASNASAHSRPSTRKRQPAEDLEGLQAQLEQVNAGTGEVRRLLSECAFTPGARAYTSLIKRCSKPHTCTKALEILDHMKDRGQELNTITYTSVITACGRAGQVNKAMELYNEMRRQSIHANLQTFTALISACARARQCARAAHLFDAMQNEYGEQPDHIVYSAMISACEKGHDPDRALEVFNQMESRGYEANTMTYNSLLAVLAQSHQEHRAQTLSSLRSMQSRGITPDNSSFAHALYVCYVDSLSAQACSLLREAESFGIPLEKPCFLRALEACMRADDRSAVLDVLARILQRNAAPELSLLSRILEAHETYGSSEHEPQLLECALSRLRQTASDEKDAARAFNSALQLCKSQQRWEEALELCQKYERCRFDSSTAPRSAVISACASAGQLERASECLRAGIEQYPESEQSALVDSYVYACCQAKAGVNAASEIRALSSPQLISSTAALTLLGDVSNVIKSAEGLPYEYVATLPLLYDRLVQFETQPIAETCGAIADALYGQQRPVDAAEVAISGAERAGSAGLPSRQSLNLIRRACISEAKPSYATTLTEWMRSCGMEPDESYEARGETPPSSSSTYRTNGHFKAEEQGARQQQQQSDANGMSNGQTTAADYPKTANGHMQDGVKPVANGIPPQQVTSGKYAAAVAAVPPSKPQQHQQQQKKRQQLQRQQAGKLQKPIEGTQQMAHAGATANGVVQQYDFSASAKQLQQTQSKQQQYRQDAGNKQQYDMQTGDSYAGAAGKSISAPKLSKLSAAAKEFKP